MHCNYKRQSCVIVLMKTKLTVVTLMAQRLRNNFYFWSAIFVSRCSVMLTVTCFSFMLAHPDDSLPVWVCRKGPLSWRWVEAAVVALPGAMTLAESRRRGRGAGSPDRRWTRTSGKSCASYRVSSPWRLPQLLRSWIRR